MTRQSVNYVIRISAQKAKLAPVHPHMLRHSCGFYLANKGYDLRLIQDYLGHRDPRPLGWQDIVLRNYGVLKSKP